MCNVAFNENRTPPVFKTLDNNVVIRTVNQYFSNYYAG